MPTLSELIRLQEAPTKFHRESQEGYVKSRLSSEMSLQKGRKRLRKKKAQKVLHQKWQHSQISEKLSLISRGLISSFQDNIRRGYFRRMFMPIETIPKESLGV
jgi:hypothetical protein